MVPSFFQSPNGVTIYRVQGHVTRYFRRLFHNYMKFQICANNVREIFSIASTRRTDALFVNFQSGLNRFRGLKAKNGFSIFFTMSRGVFNGNFTRAKSVFRRKDEDNVWIRASAICTIFRSVVRHFNRFLLIRIVLMLSSAGKFQISFCRLYR